MKIIVQMKELLSTAKHLFQVFRERKLKKKIHNNNSMLHNLEYFPFLKKTLQSHLHIQERDCKRL